MSPATSLPSCSTAQSSVVFHSRPWSCLASFSFRVPPRPPPSVRCATAFHGLPRTSIPSDVFRSLVASHVSSVFRILCVVHSVPHPLRPPRHSVPPSDIPGVSPLFHRPLHILYLQQARRLPCASLGLPQRPAVFAEFVRDQRLTGIPLYSWPSASAWPPATFRMLLASPNLPAYSRGV